MDLTILLVADSVALMAATVVLVYFLLRDLHKS